MHSSRAGQRGGLAAAIANKRYLWSKILHTSNHLQYFHGTHLVIEGSSEVQSFEREALSAKLASTVRFEGYASLSLGRPNLQQSLKFKGLTPSYGDI